MWKSGVELCETDVDRHRFQAVGPVERADVRSLDWFAGYGDVFATLKSCDHVVLICSFIVEHVATSSFAQQAIARMSEPQKSIPSR